VVVTLFRRVSLSLLGFFPLGSTMMAYRAADCRANKAMVPNNVTGDPAYRRSRQTTRLGSGGRAQSSANRENH